MWTPELRLWLDEAARAAGFDAAGVAAVREAGHPESLAEAERYEAWVAAGHAGEMEYLKRRNEAGILLRSGLQIAVPWARSVIVCAFNYNADAPRSIDPSQPSAGWIARYAWSGRKLEDGTTVPTDYHGELLQRLRVVESGLMQQASCSVRSYVDTGPVVERSFAAQAGVGWIGKNTCVIRQGMGSWLLLGVILTSLPAEENSAVLRAADRCGTCTRCIDSCPTGALLGSKDPAAPRTMDASRCISYLTIEEKGAVDEELRSQMGRQVFGCDICQDVCPWNHKAPVGLAERMQARPELINPALDWLAKMDGREFKRRFKGSPLERTGRRRLLRNVAIAMGNSGETQFLPQLEVWSSGDDVLLAEAADWALRRIRLMSDE